MTIRVLSIMLLSIMLLPAATACPKQPGPTDPKLAEPQSVAAPAANDKPVSIANPASVHCETQGGKLEIAETPAGQQGICVLASGERCDEWAFMRGECPKK